MTAEGRYAGRNSHLKRLDRQCYRGQAYVHWTVTMQDRAVGWLIPAFYYKFRELLTHAAFRYAVTCPIYCLMPDHMHLLWIGIDDKSDQVNAMKHFRKHLQAVLNKLDCRLHYQPYDHVLSDEERLETGFVNVVDYIARNPERKGLVPVDGYRDYKFTGCLVPGYPDLMLWQPDYWDRFWRSYSFLRQRGLFRAYDE